MAPTSRLMQPTHPPPPGTCTCRSPPTAGSLTHARTILTEGTCPTGEGTCQKAICHVIIYGGLYVYRVT